MKRRVGPMHGKPQTLLQLRCLDAVVLEVEALEGLPNTFRTMLWNADGTLVDVYEYTASQDVQEGYRRLWLRARGLVEIA